MSRGPNGCGLIRTVEGVKVKRCSGCKVDHPLDAFTQGTGPGGLHRHCRTYQKQWRAQRANKPTAAQL